MKTYLAFFFVVALATLRYTSAAQQVNEPCASGHIHERLMENDPHYQHMRNLSEWRMQMRAQVAQERDGETLIIPVVVHVIHEGEALGQGSNISDEQVFSAIEALNFDFRKTPGEQGDGQGVDTGIEFCLAARDPQGNSTNGIVRINGSVLPNYADMGIASVNGIGASESSVKGLSTWPGSQYMNIWIVNEIENNNGLGGIQGYAYFPTNSPLDGLVVLHNVFGTVGNLKPGSGYNRTTTHEAGHYLALYHTFHNTNSCNTELNCNTAGDRVCDTPVTTMQSNCSAPTCNGNQQVENYMDYTSEICRDMFTEGQKTRMRSALLNDRSSLLESLGCMPATGNDAGVTTVVYPTGSMCSGTFTPEIKLTNFGSNALTSVSIEYGVSGGSIQTYAWSGNLAPGLSVALELPSYTTAVGTHTFFATGVNPNGLQDEYTGNNEAESSFEVVNGVGAELRVSVDYFGSETTWKVFNDLGNEVASGGPYIDNNQGMLFVESLCLSGGCYTLTVYDEYGDGMGFTNGSFQLRGAEGNLLVSGGGNFGEEISLDFCLEAPEVLVPVASFTAQDQTTCIGNQIDFTDASSGDPVSWDWTFQGGTPASSNVQHPQNISWNTSGNKNISLTVTNAQGAQHTITMNAFITVSAGPSLSMSSESVSCFGEANGAAHVTASGNGPFTYLWSNGDTDNSATGLVAGSYTVSVSDSWGCAAQGSTSVSQPSDMQITFAITDVACFGLADGQVSVAAMGGNGAPYTYSWQGLGNGALKNGLAAGTYQVTASDADGCVKTASASVSQPAAISLLASAIPVGCYGENNGQVSCIATGGSGNFSYYWEDLGEGSSHSGLMAGTYSVVAADEEGCEAEAIAVVNQPEAIILTVNAVDVSCYGASNGQVSASASGGNGGLTYSWQGLGNGAVKSGLGAGVYQVSVSDNSGCTAIAAASVNEPAAIAPNLSVFDASCLSATGSAMVSPDGGVGQYAIVWSNGSNGLLNDGLAPGMYWVLVSDADGCELQTYFSISSISGLSVNTSASPVSCFGEADGSALALVNGGQAPYSFSWSNGSVSQEIAELAPGAYTVTVADANGCSGQAIAHIAEPVELLAMAAMLAPESCIGLDGSASAIAMGGTAPYTFIWSNGNEGNLCYGLSAGTHSLAVYDAGGCSMETTFIVTNSCNELPEGPSLIANDCGEVNLGMDDYITCEAVEGATMYLWRFDHPTSGLLTEEYTLGGNNTFLLQNIAGLEPGMIVNVRVKAQVNQEWTDFGQSCQIGISHQVPTTALFDIYCGLTTLTNGSVVICEVVEGADEYEWSFSNSDLQSPIVLSSTAPYVALFLDYGFQQGESYFVTVRARVGEEWGERGASCEIGFALPLGIEEQTNEASLVIFPNPSNGSTIYLQVWNLLDQSSVSNIEIYDSNGRVVEKFALDHPGKSSFKTEHQFSKRLSAGIYFLKYNLNGRMCEQKLIVR
jgi:PKD repeat protein